MATPNLAPLQVSPAFQAMRRLVAAGAPEPERMEELLQALDQERRLEQAWLLLRLARPDPARWGPWPGRMKALLEQDRVRRMNVWQTDPDRATLRLAFALRAPACRQNPAGVISLLAWALLDAGLPLAVGLEKALRPAIHLAHPLPPMVPGDWEWADAILAQGAGLPAPDLVASINAHAAPGLRTASASSCPTTLRRRRSCAGGPTGAGPARRPGWRRPGRAWTPSWPASASSWRRPARSKGRKAPRSWTSGPWWKRAAGTVPACISRRPSPPAGPPTPASSWPPSWAGRWRRRNWSAPGWSWERTRAWSIRTGTQPKLHNMFEDAVPLGAGGRIQIVEDDDDEPLRLG